MKVHYRKILLFCLAIWLLLSSISCASSVGSTSPSKRPTSPPNAPYAIKSNDDYYYINFEGGNYHDFTWGNPTDLLFVTNLTFDSFSDLKNAFEQSALSTTDCIALKTAFKHTDEGIRAYPTDLAEPQLPQDWGVKKIELLPTLTITFKLTKGNTSGTFDIFDSQSELYTELSNEADGEFFAPFVPQFAVYSIGDIKYKAIKRVTEQNGKLICIVENYIIAGTAYIPDAPVCVSLYAIRNDSYYRISLNNNSGVYATDEELLAFEYR